MTSRFAIIALMSALIVAGCSTSHGITGGGAGTSGGPRGGHGVAVSLINTAWRLERIDGRGVVSHSKASLIVSREGRMGGNASCNAMFGHAKLDGNHLAFEQIGSTKMACTDADVMAQERGYFDALKQVATWRIADDKLYLTDRARKDVLVYEAE